MPLLYQQLSTLRNEFFRRSSAHVLNMVTTYEVTTYAVRNLRLREDGKNLEKVGSHQKCLGRCSNP